MTLFLEQAYSINLEAEFEKAIKFKLIRQQYD